jgi:hypothetical protein
MVPRCLSTNASCAAAPLSEFRRRRLLAGVREVDDAVADVQPRTHVVLSPSRDRRPRARVVALLDDGSPCRRCPRATVLWVMPRLGHGQPWSSRRPTSRGLRARRGPRDRRGVA